MSGRLRWHKGQGSFLDGSPLSGTTVDRLAVRPGDPIRARFGIKSDVERKGGINLFGSKFGNYGQDIVLRLEFESDNV
jgi:predicted transcriptional regulator